jgi:hypothetical protein
MVANRFLPSRKDRGKFSAPAPAGYVDCPTSVSQQAVCQLPGSSAKTDFLHLDAPQDIITAIRLSSAQRIRTESFVKEKTR